MKCDSNLNYNYLVTGSYKNSYLNKLNTLTCFLSQQLKMICLFNDLKLFGISAESNLL